RFGSMLQQKLTPDQRLHFEAFGYVVLESLLEAHEVAPLRPVILKMRDDPMRAKKDEFVVTKGRSYWTRMGNLIEYDPAILEFAAHPKIVPIAEELVGGSVRLEENETILNRRDPEVSPDDLGKGVPNPYSLHRALDPSWGCYVEGG